MTEFRTYDNEGPMPPFSFVHAADLHLDSPFVGIGKLPDVQGHVVRTLREATFDAFESVINLCISRQADFLLVAGDVYDGADRSLRAQLRFRDGLQRLGKQGIRAYVVHGNHDPLDGWSHALQMPETVHVFNDQLESVVFEKDGVAVARIHGISYPSRTIDGDFGQEMSRKGNELFQIGLFHCNVGGNLQHDPYAPRSISDLKAAKLDYWALGHVHARIVLCSSEPFVGYPGNTQGRSISESGARGCLFVNVNGDGRLSGAPKFVPTDRVRWETFSVDVTRMETMDDLLNGIEDGMDSLQEVGEGRAVVTRIVVEGRGPLHRELAKPATIAGLQEELRSRGIQRTPFLWVERLILNTRPELDLNSRRAGQDFLADLLRLIDEIRCSPDEIQGLNRAIEDLYQHRSGSKFLDAPGEQTLRELIDQAEIRCADLLAEEAD